MDSAKPEVFNIVDTAKMVEKKKRLLPIAIVVRDRTDARTTHRVM